jgi:tRNA-2-methylthio-N6-dimethylallyladenosine synthase
VGRVNIIAGCNKNCSYCIVPTTRGRELSRPAGTIISEVRELAAQGHKEILLIGQNVNSYQDNGTGLAQLLAKVNAIDGVERIRFVTSHPRDANEDMFQAMATLPKVCESLHLPFQSGSSQVLRRMYRGYSRERYLAKIVRLRELMPEITLSTDVIVGFCGETDDDFEQTLSLMREVQFDSAFMFMYSPRRGTASATSMIDDVPLAVKKERLSRLIEQQEAIAAAKNQQLIGRTFEVLVERPAKKSPGSFSGRTRGDKTVVFPADESLAGTMASMRITSANGHTLIGEVV